MGGLLAEEQWGTRTEAQPQKTISGIIGGLFVCPGTISKLVETVGGGWKESWGHSSLPSLKPMLLRLP